LTCQSQRAPGRKQDGEALLRPLSWKRGELVKRATQTDNAGGELGVGSRNGRETTRARRSRSEKGARNRSTRLGKVEILRAGDRKKKKGKEEKRGKTRQDDVNPLTQIADAQGQRPTLEKEN